MNESDKAELRIIVETAVATATAQAELRLSAKIDRVADEVSVQSRQLANLALEVEQVRMSLDSVKDHVEALAHQVRQFDRRLDFLVQRTTEARTTEASGRAKLLAQIAELRQRVNELESQVTALQSDPASA